jgi:hypothetical protein
LTRQAANSPRRSALWPYLACAGVIGVLLIACIILLPVAYWVSTRNAVQVPGPGSTSPSTTSTLSPASTSLVLLPAPTQEPLLNPAEYSDSSRTLVDAVGTLNISELEFIRAAVGGGRAPRVLLALWAGATFATDDLDLKLRQVAADAQRVATLAERLSTTTASQAGGSETASQIAEHYQSMAQLSAALVLVSQDLRQDLRPETAAAVVAEYGARLWNPALAESGTGNHPFMPYMADPSSVPQAQFLSPEAADALASEMGAMPEAWLAASTEKVIMNLVVPNLDMLSLAPTDPATAAKMETADGQNDPATARGVATAIIQAGGNPNAAANEPASGVVTAAFWRSMAVTEPDEAPSRAVAQPAYPGGQASAVTKKGTPPQIIGNAVNIGESLVTDLIGQVPVDQTNPIVTLTISNLVITAVNKRPKDAFNTFEADVVYEFDVQWSSNLVSPRFELDCVSGNHFDITSPGGSQHINAKGLLILYPGAEDAFCYASRNGNTLGSASVHFLVGDAAEATQRAIQVETDSVSLDLTLTADAAGTLAGQQTSEAATAAVLATQHALETEVYGTQTAEFRATITEIARRTENAVPAVSETPSPTATFEPILVDSLFHPGNVFAVSTNVVLQTGRRYRFCFGGIVNLTTGPVKPSDIDHVNGIAVPASGCLVLDGTGGVATISCGEGEPDPNDPGGFSIQVFDLGPK